MLLWMPVNFTVKYYPPPVLNDGVLEFAPPSETTSFGTSSPNSHAPVSIPCFDAASDPEGAASYVPHMSHFYDNSLQTCLMRDLAIDMEVLGEHLVLLGNQVTVYSAMYAAAHIIRPREGCGEE